MRSVGVHSASEGCKRLLEQGHALVSTLAPQDYAAGLEGGAFASPGAHLRHVVDYLDCLLAGIDARAIDYTARRRCPEIETDPAVALRELARCIEALEKIDPRRERSSVEVRCDEGDPWVASTLARELHFVASHTVHHFALIRVTLARVGRATPPDFGVSPSTLAHRAREARAGARGA